MERRADTLSGVFRSCFAFESLDESADSPAFSKTNQNRNSPL